MANLIARANRSYRNSGVPITLRALCISDLVSFEEGSETSDMLSRISGFDNGNEKASDRASE